MYEPFGRGFYERWAGINSCYRYGVAIAVVVVSGLLWYFDVGGWMLGGPLFLGIVLLLFAGDSK